MNHKKVLVRVSIWKGFHWGAHCKWKETLGAGITCALGYSWLAWCSRSTDGIPLLEFCVLVSIVYTVILWMFLKLGNNSDAFLIIAFALFFRIAGYYGAPIYEDDYFRYMWDGYRFATAGTPYGPPPEVFFGDTMLPNRFQQILSGINHPDIPTVYAPTFQYLFLFAYWIAPGELWPLKLIFIVIDGVILLLLSCLAQVRYLLLYAWNPLVLKEIAFTVHPDGLLGGITLIAWVLLTHGHRLKSGLSLALAAGTKVAVWPILPFLLIRCGPCGIFGFLLGISALYVPFLLHGNSDFLGLFTFATEFEFNSSIFALINLVFPADFARLLLGTIYLVVVSAYFFHYVKSNTSFPPRFDLILGGLLLISPVMNPWYLLWLLPWACITPSLTAWIASAAVLLSYATGLNLDEPKLSPYGHPDWVRPIEFGIIGLALVWDLYRSQTLYHSNPTQPYMIDH